MCVCERCKVVKYINFIVSGLGLMNHFACLLKSIAHEYHVAFVLVNISTRIHDGEPLAFDVKDLPPPGELSKSTEKIRPALGKYWAHVPSTRLLLKKSVCGTEITVSVTKSVNVPAAKWCTVTVTDRGIV